MENMQGQTHVNILPSDNPRCSVCYEQNNLSLRIFALKLYQNLS
jgi:hypothetical protein